MKILITGAAGFIGFHVCNFLINEGHDVFGLDNINDYYDINLKFARLEKLGVNKNKIYDNKILKSEMFNNFNFIKLHLEDKKNLSKLFSKYRFDAVCNLAAQAGVRYSLKNPDAYLSSNIIGFVNVLEMCKDFKVQNFSYASSSSVYGINKKIPFSIDDNADHPISLYAASKKSNELIAHTYSHLYSISTTGLRFFTVYGPWGRPDMALFLFVKAALNGKPIDVYNKGNMLRDFTYIDDIVKSIVKVIYAPAKKNKLWVDSVSSSSAPYKIYNIGNSNPKKLMLFINTIEKYLGKKIKKNYMPIQPGDVVETYADVTDFEKEFNFRPLTSIDDGIKCFIDWYKSFYKHN